jgi:molybdate transport system substrate-binding protein
MAKLDGPLAEARRRRGFSQGDLAERAGPWAARLAIVAVAALSLGRAAAADEVVVFAAASLTDALSEVAQAFEKETGHKVVFNLGGSNDLARQIRAGAPADVFFSADARQMDGLESAGLVRARDRIDVLSNALTVVVPAGSAARVRGPADLRTLERLALADPQAVPAGIYARTWLESLGLWDGLKDRVVPTLNVRAALAAVESENADAAIVYRTDAAISKRVKVAFEVPREQGPAIVYPLAPIAASRKPATAAMIRYLTSETARKVYRRYGFVLVVDN